MMKTVLTATVLAFAPAITLAQQGCGIGHGSEQVMSCASGTVWDAEAGACVEIVTG